ncbi:hypothetical protein PHYPO_G00182890 [Pangasianodon hypophthalmus]|uniref:Small ribosomal subunit protein bS6m n=1 Tax=Pangasianodon hypophthalmus TaxID=310915 RepID=A0A5N5PSU1_PANHP|nr:hypothetical protein PHYPO_G00182890 [Pangasianodon hypophthalmus]
MPRYELALVLKAMQRPETAAVLRRTVETLMERGAVVRNLENLGERRLPYKISKHNQRHTHGAYFLIDFHSAPPVLWFLTCSDKQDDFCINVYKEEDTLLGFAEFQLHSCESL